MPMDERQLDISLLVEQYQQILSALSSKDSVSLATMVEGVGMISKILRRSSAVPESEEESFSSTEKLQALLAKHGMIETLLEVVKDARMGAEHKRALLPVAIGRVSLMLRGCDAARQRMAKIGGYDRLFDTVGEVGPPDGATLRALLAMATHVDGEGGAAEDALIRNIEPVSYLLRWMMRETDYEDPDTQVWLARALRRVCSSKVQNRSEFPL